MQKFSKTAWSSVHQRPKFGNVEKKKQRDLFLCLFILDEHVFSNINWLVMKDNPKGKKRDDAKDWPSINGIDFLGLIVWLMDGWMMMRMMIIIIIVCLFVCLIDGWIDGRMIYHCIPLCRFVPPYWSVHRPRQAPPKTTESLAPQRLRFGWPIRRSQELVEKWQQNPYDWWK